MNVFVIEGEKNKERNNSLSVIGFDICSRPELDVLTSGLIQKRRKKYSSDKRK